MSSTVIVLAAGEGTRLKPYTEILPKALFPVGHKPSVRWITDDLMEQGFEEIVICVNKNDERLFRHEYEYVRHNCPTLDFSISDKPLGTSGEIINAIKYSPVHWPILVIYADDLTYTDYKLMLEAHQIAIQNGFLATLGVTTKNKLEVGILKDEHNKVVEFYEKPDVGRFGWTSWTGRAFFQKDVLPYLTEGEDIASNVFPRILDRLYTYKSDSEWLDIGNLTHYQRANKLAKEDKLW